jgi:hypothetical protein
MSDWAAGSTGQRNTLIFYQGWSVEMKQRRRIYYSAVNRRPRLTPPSLGGSIAWLVSRRRDPTPINKEEIFAKAIGAFYSEGRNPVTLDILRTIKR